MLIMRTTLAGLIVFAMTSICSADYAQIQSGSVSFPNSDPVVLTFTGTPAPISDGTLSLIATGGELNNGNKRLEQLTVEGITYQTPGAPAGWMLPINHLDGNDMTPDPVTIPLAELSSYAADGQIVISVVRPGFISGGTFDMVLSYSTAIPEPSAFSLLALGTLSFFSRRRASA